MAKTGPLRATMTFEGRRKQKPWAQAGDGGEQKSQSETSDAVVELRGNNHFLFHSREEVTTGSETRRENNHLQVISDRNRYTI